MIFININPICYVLLYNMKDEFNIVKVSDIDDVDCNKIIKKCYEKPNLINRYYPHIFMNRDKIDRDELLQTLDKYIIGVKRDKSIEQTIKKYNTLTGILESLFLCVLDINTIKNIQKFIQYNFSKDDNNIIDIVNHIIQEKPITNLEQLLNDKIDSSHSVFIIEKIIEHIKKTYINDIIELQTISQYQLLTIVQSFIIKQKYNPYINKIINYNKKDLIREYIQKCTIDDNHDNYISNIIEYYKDLKHNTYDIVDDCDWQLYFKKVSESLNIDNQKEKVLKTIHRFSILNKIVNIQSDKNDNDKTKNDKNSKQNLINNLQSIVDSNKIDKIIINSYINMLKNNASQEKLIHLENIIQYFSTYGNLSKELIKLIMPKYFAKENLKYYLDNFTRLNNLCNKKLSVIDNIIEQQKKYAEDLKNTDILNESKSIFDKDLISLYNLDHKHINDDSNNKIVMYSKYLKAYDTFTNKWFEKQFSNLKKITINQSLSNGKLQLNNTIINTNLIILNALYLFNNDTFSISKNTVREHFSEDLVDDIITTLEYYNIVTVNSDNISLSMKFLENKQEINIELIKKENIKDVSQTFVAPKQEVVDKSTMVECVIIKSIKTQKVHKDAIFDIVTKKCNTTIDKELFDKCMKRLENMDYFVIENDHLIYVP